MSVASMSRQTKRAYLRLCPVKRRKKKKNLVLRGLKAVKTGPPVFTAFNPLRTKFFFFVTL